MTEFYHHSHLFGGRNLPSPFEWCEKHKHYAYESDSFHRDGLRKKACSICGSYEMEHDLNMREHFKLKKKETR